MEQQYITYTGGIGTRTYFLLDYDEAVKFERLFDGYMSYADGGYTVTLK